MGTVTMALVAWLMMGTPETGTPPTPADSPGTFVAKTLTVRGETYMYSVYLPPGYRREREWPVILALHGAGSRGTDGQRPRMQSLAEAARMHPERYPAVLVLPQCPPDKDWSGEVADFALEALELTVKEFGGDRKRVYLAGQSMGARGVVQLAARYPERFAAVVAVAGRYPDRSMVGKLKGLPLWMWHGDADAVVPVTESRSLVELLKSSGNHSVRYTELSGLGHDIPDTVYLDQAVSTWLLAQKRGK
ncbi:putative esterase [Archangium gephyra]|uniref:Esterase n=1 Tax=Archangium gephyra TaxID=48 RepID=A0AAC8Q202_9BACT|nr:alpha/beta hydrolase-fold protein [Archangium gephyra]AKI99482.1 Putative esterase [Archangium gephyra]REG27973.1 putative esterase [Archangium gephyra]